MRRKLSIQYLRANQQIATLAIAGALLLTNASVKAELWLPKIFASDMLVQRGQPIRVWGKGDPKGGVQVGFGSRQATADAGADGGWQVTLDSAFRIAFT